MISQALTSEGVMIQAVKNSWKYRGKEISSKIWGKGNNKGKKKILEFFFHNFSKTATSSNWIAEPFLLFGIFFTLREILSYRKALEILTGLLPVPWAPAPLLFAVEVEDLRVEIEALRPP